MAAVAVARVEIATIRCDQSVIKLRLLDSEANIDGVVSAPNLELLNPVSRRFQQFG